MSSAQWLLRLLLLGTVMALSGCVTETVNSSRPEPDSSRAAQAYVDLGLRYFQQGNYDLALARLEKALEIDDRNAQALAATGLVFQQLGEFEVAEKKYKQALSIDRDYTKGRTYYGAFLFQQDRIDEATRQFEIASQDILYEARPQVFLNLGLLYRLQGQSEQAIAAYERAAVLARGNPVASLALAELYFEAGDAGRAWQSYRLFRSQVRAGEIEHTPGSLASGIEIARYVGDQDTAASLMLLLRNRFPRSPEYRTLSGESQ